MSAAGELFGTPSAAELVEAVVEFLEKDVAGELSGRRRFHLRVAVNALNIVRRQLEMNDELVSAACEGLTSLGVGSERELAAAIRDGRMDGVDEVPQVLRVLVSSRLKVNNPTYLETYT
jgi:hypothetical protein